MENIEALSIAVKAIGICDALINDKIDIDMAEVLLFKPGYCNYYKSKGVDSALIDLIWIGTELEDVQSLCPENLEENIANLYTSFMNYLDNFNYDRIGGEERSILYTDSIQESFENKTQHRKYEILGQNEQSEADILHRLHSVFQMPDEYTESWEDVETGLKDLSWTGQQNWELVVSQYDQLLKDKPETKERFVKLVDDEIIPYWQKQEGFDFKLTLREKED